jgi:hypothetical protein
VVKFRLVGAVSDLNGKLQKNLNNEELNKAIVKVDILFVTFGYYCTVLKTFSRVLELDLV